MNTKKAGAGSKKRIKFVYGGRETRLKSANGANDVLRTKGVEQGKSSYHGGMKRL